MTIRSNSKEYCPGASKYTHEVPDCHTDAYRLHQAQEMELRLYQEIQDCNEAGGKVIFFSPTYDNSHLPRFLYTDPVTGFEHNVPVFSAIHKKKFIMDIRNYLDRNYGLRGPSKGKTPKMNKYGHEIKVMSRPLKYVWPCEYGLTDEYIDHRGQKRKGTHRSHYHPLLFIPKEMAELEEFSTEQKAKDFLQSFWEYGKIGWSEPDLGIYVTKEYAALYVSKYCFKDPSYYAQPDVQAFLYDSKGNLIRDHLEVIDPVSGLPFKQLLPRHWQSQGLGIGLCKIYDNIEAMRDGHNFNFDSITKRGVRVKHRAPRYIERKLLYNVTKDGRFYLNEKGIAWKSEMFPARAAKYASKLADDFLPLNIAKYVTDEECEKATGHNRDSLRKYVLKLKGARTWFEIALYNLVWRGLFIEMPSNKRLSLEFDSVVVNRFNRPKEFVWLDSLSPGQFFDISVEQYSMNLMAHENAVLTCLKDGGYVKNLYLDRSDIFLYNDCDRFKGFEEIIRIREQIRDVYIQRTKAEYLRKRKERVSSYFAKVA